MKTEHLEIGTIQAFLDGELKPAEVAFVSSHIAACDTCAVTLAEAEDESAVVFPAIAREMDTLVPTQRLWNRINESIAVEREKTSVWQKARAFVSAAFLSPSVAAAASLLIVVAFVAAIVMNRPATIVDNDTTAKALPSVSTTSTTQFPVTEVKSSDNVADDLKSNAPRFERAAYRVTPVRQTTFSSNLSTPGPDSAEQNYLKTIASLSKTADGQKDGMFRASERVAYERDMAVVDDTISKMRNQVKKNPRNESAKQMLYTSYQNKIDLLNSVSQKQELMASLR